MAMDTVKLENKTVRMVAHRGLSGLEKENTCAAFVAACNRATYFGVETDVHRTADGQFVIFHDDNTARRLPHNAQREIRETRKWKEKTESHAFRFARESHERALCRRTRIFRRRTRPARLGPQHHCWRR